jgi:hypothetical protein
MDVNLASCPERRAYIESVSRKGADGDVWALEGRSVKLLEELPAFKEVSQRRGRALDSFGSVRGSRERGNELSASIKKIFV